MPDADDEVRTALQHFPFPEELQKLVNSLTYKPGWTFRLVDMVRDHSPEGLALSRGLTLVVKSRTFNSYHPEEGNTYEVHHYRPVPPATYDMRSWRRWLLDEIVTIEQHEACEFFQIDGERPYAPSHGPGNNPYMIREVGTDLDQRTSFKGTVKT